MSYHPPPDDPPPEGPSGVHLALGSVILALVGVLMTLALTSGTPASPPAPDSPPALAVAPAPRFDASAPSPPPRPAGEPAAEALALLDGPGTATSRYCGAVALLVAAEGESRGDPVVTRAWRSIEPAERAALREQRRNASGGRRLVCRDGEVSPSCFCRGSRRGCCSWHGGVAGCESLPDRVTCPPAR